MRRCVIRDLHRSVFVLILFSTFINRLNDGIEVVLTHLAVSLNGCMSIQPDLDTLANRIRSDENEALHLFRNSPI